MLDEAAVTFDDTLGAVTTLFGPKDHESCTISQLVISTLTVEVKTSLGRIDLECLVVGFDTASAKAILAQHSVTECRFTEDRFNNCVIYRYRHTLGPNRISLKVFCNGTLHITGTRTARECLWHARLACAMLACIFPDAEKRAECDGDGKGIVSFRVHLINANFLVSQKREVDGELRVVFPPGHGKRRSSVPIWDLPRVNEYFKMRNVLHGVYCPRDHSGLKLQMGFSHNPSDKKRTTILVFGSGQVIITGTRSAGELERAYLWITRLLRGYCSMRRKTVDSAEWAVFDAPDVARVAAREDRARPSVLLRPGYPIDLGSKKIRIVRYGNTICLQ